MVNGLRLEWSIVHHLLGVHRRCYRLWTFEQQLERLKEVFERLKEANLKLKPSKCFKEFSS